MQAANAARLAASPHLRNTRQLGTIVAMEVGGGDSAYLSTLGPLLLAAFRDRDLLIRPLGNTIYLMPRYCVTMAELDRCAYAIEDVCEELEVG